MATTLTVLSIVIVVIVLALAAWTFLIAPILVPWRHVRH
jgi:hypothetical protein